MCERSVKIEFSVNFSVERGSIICITCLQASVAFKELECRTNMTSCSAHLFRISCLSTSVLIQENSCGKEEVLNVYLLIVSFLKKIFKKDLSESFGEFTCWFSQ